MNDKAMLNKVDLPATAVKARYWYHDPKDNKVVCTLCPRQCRLSEGQRGLCFVRARIDDAIWLTTYGRSSGFCIDPIEKKPLSHFLPGTPVLSFGTAGCNLTCKFCQNWDISKAKDHDRLMALASPAMIVEVAKQTNCRSVAYTYNDPVIFLEYAVDVAKLCRKESIKNIAVTAGYIQAQARDEFFENMDAVNLDIKAFSREFYKSLCTADIENVKETAIYLARKPDLWLEVTTLLIPDENDSDDEITALCQWYINNLGGDVPLHFTAFHPDYKMRHKVRTNPEILFRAREIALYHGIHHVYCGNIHDVDSSTTYCPQCQQPLIKRENYELKQWQLSPNGRCSHCDCVIAGIFEPAHDHWGSKRMPVQFKKTPTITVSTLPTPDHPPLQVTKPLRPDF